MCPQCTWVGYRRSCPPACGLLLDLTLVPNPSALLPVGVPRIDFGTGRPDAGGRNMLTNASNIRKDTIGITLVRTIKLRQARLSKPVNPTSRQESVG